MRTKIIIILLTTQFLLLFALQVHAGETVNKSVIVRGLVVSSGYGLTINDGVQDYLLLGVDNAEIEGKICEAIGALKNVDGISAILVDRISILADEYPTEDLIGFRRVFGRPYSGKRRSGKGTALVSPGVTMPNLRTLNLPLWEGTVCG